jgi:hypothetical protein
MLYAPKLCPGGDGFLLIEPVRRQFIHQQAQPLILQLAQLISVERLYSVVVESHVMTSHALETRGAVSRLCADLH